MNFRVGGILLDIEGTTSSVSFVYDVMFPYARRELDAYLRDYWNAPDLAAACDLIAKDAGHGTLADWCRGTDDIAEQQQLVRDEVSRQMDSDVKATGLKQLQGLIWRSGFESGEMQAHVYDDVPAALERWNAAGIDIRIYSSGSIEAQKLFFGHTIAGNLLHFFRGHYDTTTGPKREMSSYEAIARDFGLPPDQILFASDIVDELAAAKASGMQTALCIRPGNAPAENFDGHPEINDFSMLEVELV